MIKKFIKNSSIQIAADEGYASCIERWVSNGPKVIRIVDVIDTHKRHKDSHRATTGELELPSSN